MNIEWWMIDGAVGLILLIAALRGAVKGIGDTIIRILCIVGGLALGIFCKEPVSEYLMQTKIRTKLYERFFVLIRGDAPAEGAAETASGGTTSGSILSSGGSGEGIISKSIGNIFDNAADKAAEAAAERLTQIAMGVIAFALIILVVCILAALLRMLIRMGRDRSLVLGFADRVLGFVLGSIRGLMLAWIAVALLIPVTTLVSPLNVPAMMDALQHTTVAKVIYDVNPVLLIAKYVFK